MTAIGRATLFSATLAGCSAGASPAPPVATQPAPAGTANTAAAAAATTEPSASGALIVGALAPKPLSGLGGLLSAIHFSPDGKILAAGGQDPFVQLWTVATGEALRTLKSNEDTASHDVGSAVTDIPGLGDKAYSSGEDPYCCALYVIEGSTLFEVVVTPFDRAFELGAPTAKLLILARAAASHL